MPLNVRIESDLEALLSEHCARTGETRSSVVREALSQFLEQASQDMREKSLYALAQDLIPEQGIAEIQSERVKEIVQDRFRAKHSA